MPVDVIRVCTYTWNYPYQSSFNTTANSISISQVEQNGVVFNISPPLFLDDYVNINAQLQGLSITSGGAITYTFDGIQVDLFGFNLHDPITQIFLIQDINNIGGGGPLPFQMPVAEQLCKFIYDPGLIRGCTDPDALNYNPDAVISDGTCAYTPEQTIDILRCSIADEAYNFCLELQSGKISSHEIDCRFLDLGFNLAVIQSAANHVDAGTILIPAAEPTPEVLAVATIDVGSIYYTYGFFEIDVSIDGSSVYNNAGEYYDTLTDLVTDILGVFPVSGYTASSVGNIITITAPVGSGSSANGIAVNVNGNQLYFFTNIRIDSGGDGCTFGCYDTDLQQIVYGTYSARAFVIFQGSTLVTAVDIPILGAEVIYNPTTQRKYMGTSGNNRVYVLDNNNNLCTGAPAFLTAESNPNYGVYNPSDQFMYWSCYNGVDLSAGATGSLAVFGSFPLPTPGNSDEPLIGYFPLDSGALPLGITVDPVTFLIYVACSGLDEFHVFDPTTMTIVAKKATTFSSPKAVCVVHIPLDANPYQIWVGGGGAVINRFIAVAPFNFIASIAIPAGSPIEHIKQNSLSGYVYVSISTNTGGYAVIDPNTYTIVTQSPYFILNGDAKGFVEDTDTGLMYLAMPQYLNGDPSDVLQLDFSDALVDYETEFDGGENPDTYNRDELIMDEDNSCYSDDVAETQLQWAKDNINGCCQ